MHRLERADSALLVIDIQQRLMPAIDGGAEVVANARRLLRAAALLDVPALATEQNPAGLGPMVEDLAQDLPLVMKMSFDACAAPGFLERLPPRRPQLLLCGCEAHVCVLQTALGLLQRGYRVHVAADAVGSRRADSKAAALARLQRHGVEIVTVEMALFEWLGSAAHPRFREVVALIK